MKFTLTFQMDNAAFFHDDVTYPELRDGTELANILDRIAASYRDTVLRPNNRPLEIVFDSNGNEIGSLTISGD